MLFFSPTGSTVDIKDGAYLPYTLIGVSTNNTKDFTFNATEMWANPVSFPI